MITKMTRYDFILPSSGTKEFLSGIQELGIVDITRSQKAVDEESGLMMEKAEKLRKQIAFLTKENWEADDQYAAIKAELAKSRDDEKELAHWGEFKPEDIERLSGEGVKLNFYSISKKKFNQNQENWTENFPIEVIDDDGVRVWFVIPGDADGFPEQSVGAPTMDSAAAREKTASVEGELRRREAELRATDIKALEKEYRELLSAIDHHLAEVSAENAAEDTLSVITGFAPTENKDELCAAFDKMDAFYLCEDATLEDNPPIKLHNNRFVKMFEVLTDMYGRPVYNEFDPTPYISIFFMLFFAMCMGDAGYGLLLVLVGYLLKKKVKAFENLAPLVMTLGVATFVVGFLFHTFFSVDISQWETIPQGLRKIMVPASVSTYDGTMVLALIVGIVHLCLAMIVKTVYATRNKGFLGSLGTWGWTLFIVGGVVVGAFALAGVLDKSLTKIIIIALGGLSALGIFLFNDIHRNPLVNIGSGLWEAYNTATGLLGDVLSYLRLYALGLAGSMLGFAFNDLAKMALGDGGIGWLFFILIVVIGHTLNIAMAALGAFVHPLRLNFLEFFKNSDYKGTGRKYNPLKNN